MARTTPSSSRANGSRIAVIALCVAVLCMLLLLSLGQLTEP